MSGLNLARLADLPRWVNWRNEPRADDPTRLTKVPYQPGGRKAAANNPRTWRTRAQVEDAIAKIVNGHGGGIGIVLGELGDGYVLAGIDLDTCRREDGTFEPWAQAIIDRFRTYTEISPSGLGAKLFFLVSHADFEAIRRLLNTSQTGRQFKKPGTSDHPPGFEIYFLKRYFAVTDRQLEGCPNTLATIGKDQLHWLLSEAGPALVGKDKGAKAGKGSSDKSRSGSVFATANRYQRQGKSFDEFCEAVRTDPKTAGWYVEKATAAGGRQLQRAWENAGQHQSDIDAVITEFNAKYAVVNEAGIAVVYQQTYDPVRKRQRVDRISFADLCKFYLNRQIAVNGADKTINVAKLWLKHKDRRQFLGGVVFDPKNSVPADCWNLWTGFAVEPKLGDWSLMREHIRRVICSGDEKHFEYLMNWLANLFQHPDKAGEVAVVLRGAKGAGKGIFGRWVHRAWGQYAMHIANPSHLVGNFNAHLRDCVFLFADEAFFAGDRQHESVLKALITEEVILIEGKYQNAVEVINMLHLLMASNSKWVVPASHDERRYFVLDVADNHLDDYPYFAAIAEQMEQGGLAAMIHELLHCDLTGFNVRGVPDSRALAEQKLHSLDTVERWWLAVLDRGYVWRSRYGASVFFEWTEFVTTELLWRSYGQWCQDARITRMQTREMLGVIMTKLYTPGRKRSDEIVGEVEALITEKEHRLGDWLNCEAPITAKRQCGYWVGSLDKARATTVEKLKIVAEWQEITEADEID